MESRGSALIIFIQIVLFCDFCFCDFVTQQLGNYVQDDEYDNRTSCWSKVCMQDSGRLIYSASHDSQKINPCDDFPTFAMGEFLEHRVPNERYAKLGFQSDIDAQFFEKQKRILNEPVRPDAPRIFKVVKSFFKKCIDSASVITKGPADMASYMKRLNLPLTSEGNWDEKNFEIQSLFDFDPDLAFSLFFDLKVVRCDQKLCGEAVDTWKYNPNTYNDSWNIMKTLKVDDKLTQAAVEDFVTFLKEKLPVENTYWIENLPFADQTFLVDESIHKQSWRTILKNFLVHLGFDPSKQLEIYYPRAGLVSNLSEIFEKLSKRFIANVFSVAFALKYQKAFIVYSFTKQEENFYGTKRSFQRFEQCVQFLETNMQNAFDALLAERLFDKSVQAAALEMVKEVAADVELVGKYFYDEGYKEIEAVNFSVMFPDEVTNVTKIIEAYKNLKLDGSESMVEMYIEMDKFNKTLEVFEKKENQESDEYDHNSKTNYTLKIPVKWTLYPSFHPQRPRFFNTAAFYREVLRLISKEVSLDISPIDVAYKNYASWLGRGNQDIHLPAFKMTSRQMFWLSAVHVMTEKYQVGVSQTFELMHQLTNKYMHVILKNKKEFRDDFQCGDMTAKETQRLAELQTKIDHIKNVLGLREFCGNCRISEDYFSNLKQSGLFDFVESVLKDRMYAADLKVMNELLKTNQWTNANLAKVFSSVCPTVEGCQAWL